MTRREAMRQTIMFERLRALGFTQDEAEQLRRISLALHHWGERKCNEDIDTHPDGSAWLTYHPDGARESMVRIPNREAGALRRLAGIMAQHRGLTYYHQTDPRGCALYIVRKADLRAYDKRSGYSARHPGYPRSALLDSCYSSVGMAVY